MAPGDEGQVLVGILCGGSGALVLHQRRVEAEREDEEKKRTKKNMHDITQKPQALQINTISRDASCITGPMQPHKRTD